MEQEIIDQETMKTSKQEKLIVDLLNSKVITRTMFESVFKDVLPNIYSKRDANVLIRRLLSEINYQKHFYPVKRRRILQCALCENKENLKRYYSNNLDKQIILCKGCDENILINDWEMIEDRLERSVKIPVSQLEKRRKAILTEPISEKLTAQQEDDMLEAGMEAHTEAKQLLEEDED